MLYIRNKFCFWLTGLTHDEIASMIDKVNELTQDNDYISKSDFDPDDYDFDPLKDYDFSEFVTNEGIDDQIECYLENNDYTTADNLREELVSNEKHEEDITKILNRLDTLESKGKAKSKK
jgi:hypothetical protein